MISETIERRIHILDETLESRKHTKEGIDGLIKALTEQGYSSDEYTVGIGINRMTLIINKRLTKQEASDIFMKREGYSLTLENVTITPENTIMFFSLSHYESPQDILYRVTDDCFLSGDGYDIEYVDYNVESGEGDAYIYLQSVDGHGSLYEIGKEKVRIRQHFEKYVHVSAVYLEDHTEDEEEYGDLYGVYIKFGSPNIAVEKWQTLYDEGD